MLASDERVSIVGLENGLLLIRETFDNEKLLWVQKKAFCYQDDQVLLDNIKDIIKPVRS